MWEPQQEGQELVILSQVLQHETNTGYEALCNLQVLECNGEKILNLKHLVTLIEQGEKDGPKDKFQVILLEDNRSIILDKQAAKDSHDSILKRHRISTHVQI